MDEAGYTGGNLLDPEQPAFAVASLRIEEAEAQQLKSRFFGGLKSTELKYSSIKKRHRPALFDFLSHLRTRPETVKFTIVDKRYALLAKMFDLLVEPAMRRDGLDFYRDGNNIGFTNLIYTILPSMEGKDFFDEVLLAFQRMMSERSLYSYALFFGTVLNHHYRDNDETFKSAIFAGEHSVGLGIFEAPKDSLNLAVTAVLTLVNFWRQDLGEDEPMTVIHDRSSQLIFYKDQWDKFVGKDVPKQRIGYDRRTYEFPLAVEKTIPDGESKNWAGLQLADVLAGAARDFANGLVRLGKDPDLEARLEAILNDETFFVHSVWPTQKISPEDLGTAGGGTSYEALYKLWGNASR